VKERPILFSGPMVRAILNGSKTQTRRAVKMPTNWDCIVYADWGDGFWPYRSDDGESPFYDNNEVPLNCPYGQPGDRLWVRETFCLDDNGHDEWPIFHADEAALPTRPATRKPARWTPSIHMPRWASRIQLEVVSVRVQRLQDISEADAQAEGARRFPDIPMGMPSSNPCRWSMESPTSTDQCLSTARWAFANYFCKVNGKTYRGAHSSAPWDANPWVWAVEFKRVAP
jgi:hypothetical protein